MTRLAAHVSPVGQWLGFFANYRLKRVSVDGGAPMTVCEAPNDRGASWADNDTIVLAPHIFGGLLRVHAAGGVPEPLTSLAAGETSHAWPQSIAERRVVIFTGGAADAPNVQVLSLATGEIRVVIAAGYCGRYVPSGHVIYVHRNTLFAVRFDIDTLETRGVPVPIVDDVADDVTDRTAHFDFANDGTLVYLSRDAVTSDRTIAWMDQSGHVEKLLDAPGRYAHLFPSPDGRKLAFVSGQDIWVLDLKRARPSRVSFNTLENQWPVWAPDSAHLVCSAQNRSGTGRSLWWLRADGADEPQMLLESADELHPSSVSPDGKYVAVHRRSAETLYDIWMLPLDCADLDRPRAGNLEVFLRSPLNEWGGVFSPNGRWVAVLLGGVRHGRDLRQAISRARGTVARVERRHFRHGCSLAQRRSSAVPPQYGSAHHGGRIHGGRQLVRGGRTAALVGSDTAIRGVQSQPRCHACHHREAC